MKNHSYSLLELLINQLITAGPTLWPVVSAPWGHPEATWAREMRPGSRGKHLFMEPGDQESGGSSKNTDWLLVRLIGWLLGWLSVCFDCLGTCWLKEPMNETTAFFCAFLLGYLRALHDRIRSSFGNTWFHWVLQCQCQRRGSTGTFPTTRSTLNGCLASFGGWSMPRPSAV